MLSRHAIKFMLIAAIAVGATAQPFDEATLYQRHWNSLNSIYQASVYPANLNVLKANTAPAGTFADGVVGRLNPIVANINGAQEAVQYVYGIFGSVNPYDTVSSFVPIITGFSIIGFVNTGSVAHTHINFQTYNNATGQSLQLRLQGLWRFVEDSTSGLSQVTEFDLNVVNLGEFFDLTTNGTTSNVSGKSSLVNQICSAQKAACTGTNQVYNGLLQPDCYADLFFTKSLGDPYVLESDSILCRAIHVNLAFIDPARHCSNVGPSGGSKCVSTDYNDFFNQNPFSPFIDTPDPASKATYDLHYGTVDKIYANTQYPNNLKVVESGETPPGTFGNVTAGRIYPIGNFDNTQDTVEYQFGIFGVTNSTDTAGKVIPVIQSYKIQAFASTGHVAASAIDYTMFSFVTNQTFPLRVQGFWRFDDLGQVIEYDVNVVNVGEFFTKVSFGIPAFVDQAVLAGVICSSQAIPCTGDNQVYDDILHGKPSCYETLAFSKSLGNSNRISSDSVVCRSIHVNLAYFRPAMHCPHVGPTGGNKCIDFSYESFFDTPYTLPMMDPPTA